MTSPSTDFKLADLADEALEAELAGCSAESLKRVVLAAVRAVAEQAKEHEALQETPHAAKQQEDVNI